MRKTVILMMSLCLVSCGRQPEDNEAPVAVSVVSPQRLQPTTERSYTFISEPYRSTALSFRVGGKVSEFGVQAGMYFRMGQLIAAIDDRDFVVRKQRAEAVFRQAEADYRRITNLYKQDNISEMNYVKAKADYEKAKADYDAAVNDLSDTRLYAPFDGYVQSVNIERYQEVQASYPVVEFIDLSKIKVEAYVPEDMAMAAREDEGKRCSVRFNATGDRVFTPEEIFITQTTSNNNISYLFTAILNNHENTLMGGMSGELSIRSDASAGRETAPLGIPQNAVCQNQEMGAYVWLVSDSATVKRRLVTLCKLRKGDKVEVLSGLKETDVLAASRLNYLSEGEKITVQK